MPEPVPSHQYMFVIPPGLVAMWAARAIYSVKPEPYIDILPDRQCMYGAHQSPNARALCDWLNTEGIKGLQAICRDLDICPHETRVVEFSSKGFTIKGNPNASYGYLYIVAYRLPTQAARS